MNSLEISQKIDELKSKTLEKTQEYVRVFNPDDIGTCGFGLVKIKSVNSKTFRKNSKLYKELISEFDIENGYLLIRPRLKYQSIDTYRFYLKELVCDLKIEGFEAEYHIWVD